jgi:hypothetical protein
MEEIMDRDKQEENKPERVWSEDDWKEFDRLVGGVRDLREATDELIKCFDQSAKSIEPFPEDAANIETFPGLLCRIDKSTNAIRKLTQAYKGKMNS